MWMRAISGNVSINNTMRQLTFSFTISLILILGSCSNSDVNPVDLSTREMHESIKSDDFDTISVNGVDYLIMERDRNNPHEGFGFMALSGKQFIEKQDSIIAYQKLILENQVRIISRLERLPNEDVSFEINSRLEDFLQK